MTEREREREREGERDKEKEREREREKEYVRGSQDSERQTEVKTGEGTKKNEGREKKK